MKHVLQLLLPLLALLAGVLPVTAQSTAFTYQGRLNDSGGPAGGSYDFQFAVYDAAGGGTQQGGTAAAPATAVSAGLFTVTLDFGGGVFTGPNRWLELAVRTNGASAFITLAPRQPLTPAPYAITAANLSGSLPAAQLSGTLPVSQLGGVVPLTQLPGAVVTNRQSGVALNGAFSGNGDGLTNFNITLTYIWSNVTVSTAVPAQSGFGYLANNAAQVGFTLPAAPVPGDTVRVTGAGAGGWKITPGGSQSILAGNFANSSSSWVLTSAPNNRNWFSLASSADGTRLAAAGGGVFVSADSGAGWQQVFPVPTNPNFANWVALASSADGTKLVTVRGSAVPGVYTSTNSGTAWTSNLVPEATGKGWSSVASSADGTRLVAVGSPSVSSPFSIYTSADSGATWTLQTHSPAGNYWYSVASSADGTRLVAAAVNETTDGINYHPGLIYVSADAGATWSAGGSPPRNWQSVASSADGAKLIAAEPGGIYISSDSGGNWTAAGVPNNQWATVASSADGTKLFATAFSNQSGNAPATIYGSSDSGAIWLPLGAPLKTWYPIACSADGIKLVAAEEVGGVYTSQTATSAGTGYITGGRGAAVELQYLGGGQWTPLSFVGAISAY